MFKKFLRKEGGKKKEEKKDESSAEKREDPKPEVPGWTIHIKIVEDCSGVRIYKKVTSTASFVFEKEGDATVEELINACKGDPKTQTVSVMDLKPFDESFLGEDTGRYGRVQKQGKWVPEHKNPRPPNCSWNPDIANPLQTLAEAGLCNGAELMIIQIEQMVG
jgi:hypothetical protein